MLMSCSNWVFVSPETFDLFSFTLKGNFNSVKGLFGAIFSSSVVSTSKLFSSKLKSVKGGAGYVDTYMYRERGKFACLAVMFPAD